MHPELQGVSYDAELVTMQITVQVTMHPEIQGASYDAEYQGASYDAP